MAGYTMILPPQLIRKNAYLFLTLWATLIMMATQSSDL